jgi:site-specific DNA-methyltransferase (adenine-specific)
MDFPKGKKYSIILSDPPWAYRDKREKHPRLCGGASVHYSVMSTPEICSLPVEEIAADDAMLFLWSTYPNLPEAFKVIPAWGFEYRTIGFCWVKVNKRDGKPFFGIGHYTKSNAEVCLLAIRGRPRVVSNYVSSVIISPREEHSKKPDEARDRIVQLCGDVPRIELFARKQVPGWDCWGNEV